MRILVTALAVLVLLTPAVADRSEASKAFFDAYYLEKAKRDLEGARAAYEKLLGDEDLPWNLEIRARIGLARIAARTGKGDAKALLEHAASARRHLTDGPRAAEWDSRDQPIYDALGKEIAEAQAVVSGAKEPDEVAERIEWWISVLASSDEAKQRAEAIDSLKRFGRRAVPRLSETLRSPYPHAVSGAARVLVMLGEVGKEPLEAAFDDMDVLFPVLIAEALSAGDRVLTAAAGAAIRHPDPEVRSAGAMALRGFATLERSPIPQVQELLLEALDDKEARIRRIVIGVPPDRWDSTRLILAMGKALNDRDPGVVSAAWETLSWSSSLTDDVPEELHGEVLGLLRHDDPKVRAQVVSLCSSRGGKLAREVVLLGLADETALVRETAGDTIHDGRVAIDEEVAEAFAEGVEKLIREAPGDAWRRDYRSMLDIVGRPVRGDGDRSLLVGPLIAAVSTVDSPRRNVALLDALALASEIDWRKADGSGLLESYSALASDADRAVSLRSFAEMLGRNVVPLARGALDAESDELRLAAARILAESADARKYRHDFGRLAGDSSAQVRRAAILALGALGNAGAGKETLEAYKAALSDPSIDVRHAAILPALMALESEALPLILATVVEHPKLAPVAVQAVAARMKHDEALLFLKKVLPLAGGVTTLSGAEAWAAAERVLTDEMVLEALRREDHSLLLRAATIAGERNLLDAWPILLEKPQIDQVRQALDRIRTYHLGLKEYQDVKEFRGGDAASKAAEMAVSSDAGHRRAAAYALGALGDASAIGLLLDLVRDEDADVREAALAALKRLGGAPEKEAK